MELTILGSGTGEPSLTRGFPGILLRAGGRLILIDGGSGTLRALLKEGVTYRDIDEAWYTHLHCDHVSELGPLLFAMKNMARPREKDLVLLGPPGFTAFYRNLLRLYGGTLDPGKYSVRVEEAGKDAWERGGVEARSLPMSHTPSSVGYRAESGGAAVAVSGDTAYCRSLVELARGADLLVAECSFPEEMGVEGHLTPRLAGRAAKEAGCGRLLLTHLYPACEGHDISGQCAEAFSGEIIVAHDGLTVEVQVTA